MALFFILSGVFAKQGCSMMELFKKRFRQLILPTIYFAIILESTKLFALHEQTSTISSTLKLPYALWFLTTLFLSQLLCGYVLQFNSRRVHILGFAIMFIGGCLMVYHKVVLPFNVDCVMTASALYMFGFLLKDFILKVDGKWLFAGLALLFINVLLVKSFNVSVNFYMNYCSPIVIANVAAVAGSFGIISISKWLSSKRIGKILAVVGINSLQIMLVHQLIIGLFKHYAYGYFPNDFLYSIVELAVIAMILPLVVWFINKRVSWIVGK